MIEIIKNLKGNFVLMDLGSANSGALFKPFPDLAKAATVIKVDARATSEAPQEQFHRVINLKKAVAGSPGYRPFYCREFPECSSFLQPKEDLVKAYGLDDYFRTKEILQLECATVSELLAENGISRVDLFKTDLEGLDFEILLSAPEIVQNALCIQNELRFQPFFQGEPYFHEVVAHLASIGFEMISLQSNVWKYRTPNRAFVRDGRTAWTDAFFFLGFDQVRERFPSETWKAYAKQVLLARMLGLNNFSEFLFMKAQNEFPTLIRDELARLVKGGRSLAYLLVAAISKTAPGRLFLGANRRLFAYGYTLCATYKDDIIGINRTI